MATDKSLSPQQREAAYVAQLDKIVAPLQDYQLSADDSTKISAAFKAIAAGGLTKAKDLQASISDPLARTLIDWERLRRGEGQAAEYLKFLSENPDWPSREQLQRRMEETLFEEGGDTDVIATYFKGREARSPAGMAVLASVHLAHGEKEEAKALAVKVWREKDLPASLEKGFLSRFGSMLNEQDHKWRLDRLLGEDVKQKDKREDRAAQAKRVIALLSADEQKTAQARLSVFMRAKGGKTSLGSAQKSSGADWGAVFHKIQHLRRAGKVEEATKLLGTAPLDPSVVANLDDWWIERRSLAYLALKANKPKLAYEIVRDAGPVSVNELNDQTFMAGWIALRYLKDVKQAEKHFADLVRTADGPLSRGRAHYWMGRTAEVLGETERARTSYQTAARENDTFHGLLAMQKLSPGRLALAFDPPAIPSPDLAARFTNHNAAKAIALARKADLGRGVTRVFMLNLAKIDKDEAWAAMAAHLARVTGDTQTAVRIGKASIANGQNLVYYSYPVHALPKYTPLRPTAETAMLLGLARQETEFNSDTVSTAGARGILQVMKVTGGTHLPRLQDQVHLRQAADGRYLQHHDRLGLCRRSHGGTGRARTCSPFRATTPALGRTRHGSTSSGDPRRPASIPIDWIERIPIERDATLRRQGAVEHSDLSCTLGR